jgi:hypothetical protein
MIEAGVEAVFQDMQEYRDLAHAVNEAAQATAK